jgi:nucleotide-binding universal stress UspA family protein
MNFKTILVNLNCESQVPELVAAAATLARPEKAHVIGVYVTPPLLTPSVVVFPMGSAFYDEQIAEYRATAQRIKATFDDLTRGAGFVAEWRVHGDVYTASQSIADGMIEEARTADLVIVSQGRGGLQPMLPDVAERVAIESGRPVLVIPMTWVAGEYGRNVAVAWNGSREATRAVFDSLPLLERAERIRLVTVGAQMSENGGNTIPSAELAATMARHGLDVEVESIAEDEPRTADAILSQIAVDGADLLVMGAYGHSRMRELILGGATRAVLKNMTIPVLMSH